jgi:hypothetical protein
MKSTNLRSRKSANGFSLFLLILSFGVVLTGCYPGDGLTPAETDVITTFYKDGTDFSTKLTYSMPDTVMHIGGDDEIFDEQGPYDRQILNRIAANMADMGYDVEANPANADVLVAVAITTRTWVSGGCYPWWGYWYPWYGCMPYSYSWQTGSIIILMGDGDAQLEDEAIWFAGINGILEGSSSSVSSRINNNIDQAFDQSGYLGDGK